MKSQQVIALTILALSGCGTAPVVPLFDINGTWRSTSLGGYGIACLEVQGNLVVSTSDGCTGTTTPLLSSQPIVQTGDVYVFQFVVLTSSNDPLSVTYTVELQPDGTLVGTSAASIGQGVPPLIDAIVMNKL